MNVPFLDLPGEYKLLRDELLQAFDETLSQMRLYMGPQAEAFEREWAEFCGVSHAVAVSSGTSALMLALRAAEIGPGDEVITTAWTFIATVEAIVHVGARPVLVDVRPDSLTIDPEQVAEAITPRTRAIIPVHIYGHPADMDPIMQLAEEREIFVLEDAAQAHGALYKGRVAGSLGHAAAFSFYVTKNLGAYGEGGAVTTNSPTIAERVRLLRNHGRTEKAVHAVMGFNERLHELQAVVLRAKLKRLPEWNARRRQIAEYYLRELSGLPLRLPVPAQDCQPAWHLFVIRTKQRDRVIEAFEQAGIGYAIHYATPVHRQPAVRPWGLDNVSLPNTEAAAEEVLAIPVHPLLSDAQVEFVCQVIRRALS